MYSLAPQLAYLLDAGYPVLAYNGQLDVICGAPLTERYLMQLPWRGLSAYQAAGRTAWFGADGTVSGYARRALNLTQIIVRGAGHILPFDQPVRALDMVNRFISGAGW
jgi:vitellogenic carboxypeptidase-like protein